MEAATRNPFAPIPCGVRLSSRLTSRRRNPLKTPGEHLLAWAALVLTFLSAPLLSQVTGRDAGQSNWPFGEGSRFSSRGDRDYYNLGILGAKASDDPSKDKVRESGGGRQTFEGGGNDKSDDGPKKLHVRLLFPGGPAEKAGILIGDAIVAVNGKSLDQAPSLETMAEALKLAEGKTGKIELRIERKDAPKPITFTISLVKKPNPAMLKPIEGKGRGAILDAALEFLSEKQSSDGGFPETLSGSNGAVVQAALGGLAWLAGGSDLRSGKYRENIDRAVSFITRVIDQPDPFGGARGASDANWNQSNWSYVHAAIFLGELHARSPSPRVKKELERIVKEIETRQETSGGWAHGPGGPNALNYVELNIMTALALSGLGCAKVAGLEVSEETVKKALAYIEASGPSGGVGYADKAGQKGMGNIGRTAGCWLGMRLLTKGTDPYVQKMADYTKRNIADVLGGHASLMQHIFLAGVAAPALGKDAVREYWAKMERDLVLARTPAGSLQPRPWHESLLMGSNSDVSFGEVWTTAAWAIVLGAEPFDGRKGGLPTWLGQASKKK